MRPYLVLGVLICAAPLRAQDAERLYEAGAYRAAGDSFAVRAAAEPSVAAHWYNLGNALYRQGDDTRARAAWVRAARLAPRNSGIHRALALVPAPDANTAEATRIAPVTPGEVLVLALVLWATGWVVVVRRGSRRVFVPILLAAVLVGGLGGAKALEYRKPVALIRYTNTSLRVAPYASARTRRAMNQGTSVEPISRYAGWVLVRRGTDRGWVLATEIVPVTAL